jgi:hypothetical protein
VTGVQVSEQQLNTECPGFQEPGIAATACKPDPGCTSNFLYTDGPSFYIGTAAHCTERVGEPYIIQVDNETIANVGTVVKRTAQQEPGEDFALAQLDPAAVATYGLRPGVPLTNGPQGIYTGCDPQLVQYYGHGYGVVVAQGKPGGGLGTVWHDDGYGWAGTALPGDSGSPAVLDDGRAAGNLTHLVVSTGDFLGANVAGTRITAILQFAGVSLLNADMSTTPAASTNCGSSVAAGSGGGGGGGGGKGGGNGKGGGPKKS